MSDPAAEYTTTEPTTDAVRPRTVAPETLFNVCFVVVVLAVIPWDHVWKRYDSTPGAPWR